MTLAQRIDLLVRLGDYIKADNEEWQTAKQQAYVQNGWFVPGFINMATSNIAGFFLEREKLESWVKQYNLPEENANPKTVGLVMAGNIPLVGFHDFLAVFITGHIQVIKASSKDAVLIKHLVKKLYEWEVTVQNYVSFAEMLKSCDAYIATGSNNSGRYFEYYFSKYPNIIRKNRTSVAVLDATETPQELDLLADDMQQYFGLGCRNITKLYVPKDYDFLPLLGALKKYNYFLDIHKYKNNFDYQLALLLLNNRYYMSSGAVILTENEPVFSPVSQVNFEYYTDREQVLQKLNGDDNIQCIAGKGFIAFGQAQQPSLTDYADGVDTMDFLKNL
ncbi:acyl-CoA reductase [Foetidibacter luteolus]|uniref:acyl-CoA reductase n=1 Tax=Foetidibacter luteolus TaxID=2608880 RepID=UPI00129B1697|nr:acyl-CoA reductase [Foetidibacter luteolus]